MASGRLASMRLMVIADNPEVLCIPRVTVQAVLRDKPSTRLVRRADKATLHQCRTDFLNLQALLLLTPVA